MHDLSERYAVPVQVARLYTDRFFRAGGSGLRRAVTALFPDDPLLHHHGSGGKVDYSLSRVRYLVLDGVPHLVGLGEGREAVCELSTAIGALRVGEKVYRVTGVDFIEDVEYFGTGGLVAYASRTPWLALNQANLEKFNEIKGKDQRCRLLERILVGNILSLAKGLDIRFNSRIQVRVTRFSCRRIRTPLPMLGFRVEFVGNVYLPRFLGLGKLVSKGFGLMAEQ